MGTALGVLAFCFVAYIVISAQYLNEKGYTIKALEEDIAQLEHENERLREGK